MPQKPRARKGEERAFGKWLYLGERLSPAPSGPSGWRVVRIAKRDSTLRHWQKLYERWSGIPHYVGILTPDQNLGDIIVLPF